MTTGQIGLLYGGITFILLFIANFVMSAVYFQLVPPKGG